MPYPTLGRSFPKVPPRLTWLLLGALLPGAVPCAAGAGASGIVAEASDSRDDDAPRASSRPIYSIPTAFAYSTRLLQRGEPADGVFDFSFEIYARREGGVPLARLDATAVEVRGGLLEVELDFGFDALSAGTRWIEVRRQDRYGGSTILGDRQRLSRGATGCIVDEDVLVLGTVTVDRPDTQTKVALLNGRMFVQSAGSFSGLAFEPGRIVATGIGPVGSGHPFYLNRDGGHVAVGDTDLSAPLSVPGEPDAKAGSGGAIVLGNPASVNLAIDGNEIMARNGGATSALTLNASGGDVRVGGDIDIGLVFRTRELDETIIDVDCPTGTRILTGGCASANINDPLIASFPFNSTTWRCHFQDTSTSSGNKATAVCGRVRW